MFNHPIIQSSNHPPLPATRWDALKIIALLLMFVDHAGYFFFDQQEWIRGIGRACAPIFLFLVGFAPHTKFSRKLLLLAILLTAVDWWVKGAPNTLNILWSILIIRLLLTVLEQRKIYALKLHEWVIGALALLPIIIVTQYGSLGLLIALAGYVYKHRTHYAPRTPVRFLIFVMAVYGMAIALLSQFGILTTIAMTISLIALLRLIFWFVRSPLARMQVPASLKFLSRYTAEIYVGHLMVLVMLTGKAL